MDSLDCYLAWMSSAVWWEKRFEKRSGLEQIPTVGWIDSTHPCFGFSLPGRGLQSRLCRVDVLLDGDDLVVYLLQLGLLLLLHADRHVVVLLHHQSHHLLVLRLHRCLRLRALLLGAYMNVSISVLWEQTRSILSMRRRHLYGVIRQFQFGHQVLNIFGPLLQLRDPVTQLLLVK